MLQLLARGQHQSQQTAEAWVAFHHWMGQSELPQTLQTQASLARCRQQLARHRTLRRLAVELKALMETLPPL
jgi:hypothetical protein